MGYIVMADPKKTSDKKYHHGYILSMKTEALVTQELNKIYSTEDSQTDSFICAANDALLRNSFELNFSCHSALDAESMNPRSSPGQL